MKELLLKINQHKILVAIFICWLFHINGILGIMYGNREWFLSNTPLNLGISFLLLIWTLKEKNLSVLFTLIIGFCTGMIAEIIGVNTGILFGNYWYGENLGVKFMGVPLLIGVNWAILTFIIGALSAKLISQKIILHKMISIILGAFLMVVFDFLIEPSASKFDFWYWENDQIPLKNYVDWFLVALIPQTTYHLFIEEKEHAFSLQLLLAQIVFFIIFLYEI